MKDALQKINKSNFNRIMKEIKEQKNNEDKLFLLKWDLLTDKVILFKKFAKNHIPNNPNPINLTFH